MSEEQNKTYTQEEVDALLAGVRDAHKVIKDADEQRFQDQVKRVRMRDEDMDIIASSLRKEAQDREWCSDYNYWIEEVNSKTTILKLYPSTELYEVKVKLEERRVAYTTISVEATSPEDAIEAINDSYSSSDFSIHDSDWEVIEDDMEVVSAHKE